ncbi:MAG: Protein-L-isoaspartate O-methyltransferase [Steroidobacteraceae bacterium]|nr:Protein-L-isoaspartate O-methyltransferase [Steroidobacteraceae bacterium]
MSTVALDQMVMQQVRAWDVFDDRVLETMRRVPRAAYVPQAWRDVAYADATITLAHGQRMLAPKVIGRILQAVAPTPLDNVLEIGTGSGYLTACLAATARQVHSVEIYGDLANAARGRLAADGFANADVRTADAFELTLDPRYNIIVLTGSLPRYDERFQAALEGGGRLFAIVGDGPAMSARLVRRTSSTTWTSEDLFETWVEPLVHAERPRRFVF